MLRLFEAEDDTEEVVILRRNFIISTDELVLLALAPADYSRTYASPFPLDEVFGQGPQSRPAHRGKKGNTAPVPHIIQRHCLL